MKKKRIIALLTITLLTNNIGVNVLAEELSSINTTISMEDDKQLQKDEEYSDNTIKNDDIVESDNIIEGEDVVEDDKETNQDVYNEDNSDIINQEQYQENTNNDISDSNKENMLTEELDDSVENEENYVEEQGESKAQAEQIILNKENVFNINKSYAYDWKKVVLPTDGYIDISIDKALVGASQEKNIEVLLENEWGNNVYLNGSSSYDGDENSSKNTWRIGLAAGTYYLKWKANFSLSIGEINLKYNVNFTPTNYFEKENNDTIGTANSINFGQVYNGIMRESSAYGNDYEDCYSVYVNDSDIIVNLKTNIGENFSCYLYDSIGNSVSYKEIIYEDGGIKKYKYKNLISGKYYIKIYSSYAKRSPYEIKVEKVANGWSLENGVWCYYEDGKKLRGQETIGGKTYYFNESGAMQIGWINLGSKWYYHYEDGSRAYGWLSSGDRWYYLDDEDGEMAVGEKFINHLIYVFDDNGAMQENKWYYTKEYGYDNWYYLTKDGSAHTGWLNDNGTWYYFDFYYEENSEYFLNMATGSWDIDGKVYYFNENGKMNTNKGWILNSYGNWYYLNGDGTVHTGWLSLNGTWYYMDDYGWMVTGLYYINGKIYYFKDNGAMNTTAGWKQIDWEWYYLYKDGTVHVGWKQIGNKWYYTNEYGVMVTGFNKINGKYYYFDYNGVMQT